MTYLYFNGDSFVAGTELGDDILPGYPGLAEYNTHTIKYLEWFKKIYAIKHKDHYPAIKKLEYERSFPNKIATKLGLPFTNNAVKGSSMDKISRTTITDLISLKKSNVDKKIIAVVGTAPPGRSEVPLNRAGWNDKWVDMTANPALQEEPEEVLYNRKYKVMHETDYHHLVNFYKNVILIKDFCKSNDIQLYWFGTWHHYDFWRDWVEDEDYKLLKEYANLKYAVVMWECIENNFLGQKIQCPGGHFSEAVHDFVADRFVEIIRKNI